MEKIKDKNTLKRVAKDWVKGIIMSCETDAFWEAIDEGLLTMEEAAYIVEYTKELANKIAKGTPPVEVTQILRKHFNYEE